MNTAAARGEKVMSRFSLFTDTFLKVCGQRLLPTLVPGSSRQLGGISWTSSGLNESDLALQSATAGRSSPRDSSLLPCGSFS